MRDAAEKYGPIAAHAAADIPRYYEAGQGTPLVLLHGIGSSGASWEKQLCALSLNYRVLAWDAPGYMNSMPLPQTAPVAADYAQKLSALLDHRGIESCYLLGHSLGALVAASFAQRWPDRVLGLMFADPAQGYARASKQLREEKLSSRLSAFSELGKSKFARSRSPRLLSPHASHAQIKRVCDIMAQLNEGGYTQAANMLASGDLLGDARQFNGPTLVLCGSEDTITPPDGARELAEKLPSAQYRTIDEAGHASYIEQPEHFNELILNFVESNSQTTDPG